MLAGVTLALVLAAGPVEVATGPSTATSTATATPTPTPAPPAAARAVAPLDPATEAEIVAALRTAPAGGARAARATRPLLGAPYLPSALGEGEGADPDPRFRLDAFDCMTFVETAVALGSAAGLADAARALDDVRYAGRPARAERNHEVLSQWIPSAVARGWVADATAAAAGALARRETKTYSPESWAAVRAAGRAVAGLPRARLPRGEFAIDVVAPDRAAEVAGRVPEGAIAFVVREDRPDRATRITHAGLVVRGARGDVRVRHATSSKGVGRVIEEPVARFVLREQRAYPAWPLAGLAFFEIRANEARLRSLPGARSPARTPARGTAAAPLPAPL